MEPDLKTGICVGAAISAVGVVYIPAIPADPITAAVICASLGGLALLAVALPNRPFGFGCGMVSIALLGGYSLLGGIISGPAALGVGLLALAATAALVVRTVPVRPVRRPAPP